MTIPEIPEGIPASALAGERPAETRSAPVRHSGSAKAALSKWMDDQIKDQDEFRVSDLSRQAVEAFGGDPKFMQALANELFPTWIRGLARTRVANTRRLGGSDVLYEMGDLVVTKRGLEQRANVLMARWGRWFESVNGKYIALPFMTRHDLTIAADTRQHAADTDIVISRLWRELADGLEEGEKVADKFTAEQIEQRKQRIEKSVRG